MAFEALNEKLKNVGKKKPGAEKTGSSTVKGFFKKNAFMKYVIPVMVFVVLIAVFLAIVFSGDTTDPDVMAVAPTALTGTADESAAVLPDDTNIIDTTDQSLADLIKSDPFSEDIVAHAVYTGCVVGDGSYRLGVIENGGISYTLAVGDTLGGSSWEVKEITPTAITLTTGTLTKTLTLSDN